MCGVKVLPKVTRVRKIDSPAGFDSLEPVWNTLVSQTDTDNIFLTYEWNRTWWRVYGKDHRLNLLVVEAADDIIGLAPLMVTESTGLTGKKKIMRFISTPDSDYCDFIGADKRTLCELVIGYLYDHPNDWTTIQLTQIPEASSSLPILKTLLDKGKYAWRTKVIDHCLEYVYDGNEADRANFTIRKGHSLRQAMNFFKKGAGLDVTRSTDLSTIRKELPILFDLHINRWRGTTTPSRFRDASHRTFFLELTRILAPKEMICFQTCKTGSLPISSSVTFRYNRTIYHYTLAVNPYFLKRSPGKIHFVLHSEMLVRMGFNLDFSRGAGEYKKLLSNREKNNYEVTIARSRLGLTLAQWYDWVKRTAPVRQLIKNRRVMDYKARLFYAYASYGFSGLLRKLFARAIRAVVQYRVIRLFDNKRQAVPVIEPQRDIQIEKQDVDGVAHIATFLGIESNSQKLQAIEERFQDGDDCYMTTVNGCIAALVWGSLNKEYLHSVEREYSLKHDEVFLSLAGISPVYAELEPYLVLISHMTNMYHEQNYRVLTACDPSDCTQIQSLIRAGFSEAERLRSLKLLGFRIF